MTPTPPSMASSYSGNSPDNFRIVRKRNRIPLSCAPCRHRKLKCNRQIPCDNCTKRGDSTSCAYAAPTARKKGSTHSSLHSTSTAPDDMQNRIDRLEGLVLSLMTNGSQSAGPTAATQAVHSTGMESSIGSGSLGPNLDTELDETRMTDETDMDDEGDGREEESETDGVTKSFGVLKVDAERQKTFYLGEAHWAALLTEIAEVKNHFQLHRKEYEAQTEKVAQMRRDNGTDVGAGPALLFGATIPPSRTDILGQIPSRYMSDILIGRYFNTYDPATHILHGPTFQRQYDQHWSDPSKSSIVWVAMLFAMMRLAMLSYGREGDEPPEFRGKCQDLAATFRTQMAHCLITADYTKPHNHIIEALIFHLHAEYTSNRDAEASVWVLVGMIARLAMRMGYHRDSKLFPNLSPFQGEMRRRVWTFVRSADLLFSFQVALPSMIRIGDSDTELPRNIFDDEFDEDSASLPPGRPGTEATPISYMISKGRLSFGFGRVLEEINGVDRKGYDEVLKIDRGLRDIYESIPEHLRLRPMSEQQLAPITLIMARFSLATVYHKSQCVLHRRFMRLAKGNNRYMHSRRTCLDSAMQLLSFQATQDKQRREKGRMRTLRNHVNSLTTHDFLLAATVVCMDLYHHRERPASANESDISTPATSVSGGSAPSMGNSSTSNDSAGSYVAGLHYTRDDLIKSLEESRDIWRGNRDVSMEAYKASELLDVLLQHIRLPYSPTNQPAGQFPAPAGPTSGRGPSNVNDEQTAAMTLGLLQSGGMMLDPSQPGGQGVNPSLPGVPTTPGGNMVWDNNAGGMNPYLDLGQGVFGAGASNGASPFPNNLFGGAIGGWDQGTNFDWEAWDQYMQPANLSLDPAANLWSNTSPGNNSNNLFHQPSQADSLGPNANDKSFGMNPSFYPSNAGDGSTLNGMISPDLDMGAGSGNQDGAADTGEAGASNTGADTFMGVSTPQPGGLPPSWKWTVLSERR